LTLFHSVDKNLVVHRKPANYSVSVRYNIALHPMTVIIVHFILVQKH